MNEQVDTLTTDITVVRNQEFGVPKFVRKVLFNGLRGHGPWLLDLNEDVLIKEPDDVRVRRLRDQMRMVADAQQAVPVAAADHNHERELGRNADFMRCASIDDALSIMSAGAERFKQHFGFQTLGFIRTAGWQRRDSIYFPTLRAIGDQVQLQWLGLSQMGKTKIVQYRKYH